MSAFDIAGAVVWTGLAVLAWPYAVHEKCSPYAYGIAIISSVIAAGTIFRLFGAHP